MDKSESIPICKDCKYFSLTCSNDYGFYDEIKLCTNRVFIDMAPNIIITGHTVSGSDCLPIRADVLKCGPKGSFFEYSRLAKLKIAIKEVFNSDK